ncbi:MAG: UDP-N-acetylmuramoyl-tripeptide--D-alanyl-D-alanine ligase [Limnochordia bacterium]|jgi:UDP-N-acetylmuramoyl-tripeptide--D-alanyl-D-alanine ligase
MIQPREILAWTDGHLLGGTLKKCSGVFIDSRRPRVGGLFVALRGERFDGHDFVGEAAAAGAEGAVIMASEAERVCSSLGQDGFFVVAVADTLAALHGLAHGHRGRFHGPMIGVTGSNGKTTTKEMIAACLGMQASVLATYRNLNNEIGVPLTLLGLEPGHQICVVEMATRGLGQITQLASIVEPNLGVVTNVGPVHLATLGSLDNVARAKAELVTALPTSGTVILNADDSRVAAMQTLTKARVVTFGTEKAANIRAEAIVQDERGVRFALWINHQQAVSEVTVSLPGKHNVSNALAALATSWVCGHDLEEAADALAQLRPAPMRLEISRLPEDILLINDSYNASPLSMQAAIEVLADSTSQRRVAVLGDMLELGSQYEYYHHQVGRQAVAAGVDFLVCVGEAGRLIAAGAREAGLPLDAALWYADALAAAAAVGHWLCRGDGVLVKASRGLQLEQVAAAVMATAQRLEGRGSW